MITRAVSVRAIILPLLVVAGLTSCKKENSISADDSASVSSATIAVAASARTSVSGDSVYVLCASRQRVAIGESELPASATAYLSTNYSGYIFNKAFILKDNVGATTAYVAIVFYNDKPVAVQFDVNGNFVRVLEQRERGDIGNGGGWHAGGRFQHRDGRCRDTIALNLVPLNILAYFVTNYSSDTLVKAFTNAHDMNYVIISKNNGLYATVFTNAGVFVRRVALPTPPGHCQPIEFSALPATISAYLSTTYPNYVFEKAFASYRNGTIQSYVVIINANNTKYAIRFDVSGIFVAVKVIW